MQVCRLSQRVSRSERASCRKSGQLSINQRKVFCMSTSILLIEDDPEIHRLLKSHVEAQGYTLIWEQEGNAGLARALREDPLLCILDLELPGLNGLHICSKIREEGRTFPILMLTSRQEESDKVLGLKVGADDYLCKPFGLFEFTARIEAMIRRAKKYSGPAPVASPDGMQRYGDLLIDLYRHEVTRAGTSLGLTVLEFDLLLLFAHNPGRVFTREQLLNDVWEYTNVAYEGTVNTHITRLRKKIEPDPANPTYIKTVWGIGYRGADESELSGK